MKRAQTEICPTNVNANNKHRKKKQPLNSYLDWLPWDIQKMIWRKVDESRKKYVHRDLRQWVLTFCGRNDRGGHELTFWNGRTFRRDVMAFPWVMLALSGAPMAWQCVELDCDNLDRIEQCLYFLSGPHALLEEDSTRNPFYMTGALLDMTDELETMRSNANTKMISRLIRICRREIEQLRAARDER
jgi:hypothetical protein